MRYNPGLSMLDSFTITEGLLMMYGLTIAVGYLIPYSFTYTKDYSLRGKALWSAGAQCFPTLDSLFTAAWIRNQCHICVGLCDEQSVRARTCHRGCGASR